MKRVRKYLTIALMSVVIFVGFSSAKQINASADQTTDNVQNVALSQLGKGYQYGAVGPNKFDCSGFTKYAYQSGAGVNLDRTAQQQFNNNQQVNKNQLQPGDLVFFGGSSSSISHVGLVVGNNQMVDAQNRGVVKENINAPWWHFVGASRPVANAASQPSNITVQYSKLRGRKTVKKNSKYAVYSQVPGTSVPTYKTAPAKRYRGKKVKVSRAGMIVNDGVNGQTYNRISYRGRTIGWVNVKALR